MTLSGTLDLGSTNQPNDRATEMQRIKTKGKIENTYGKGRK